MKVSDFIVNFLIDKNITDVFGYPGGPKMCIAFFAVSDALVMGLDASLSKLPYLVCESLICQVWPDDKMYKGVAWIMDQ